MKIDHEKKISNFLSREKILKDEVDDLKNSLWKATLGKENLDILLGKQKVSFFKAGCGYNPSKKKEFLKDLFLEKHAFKCHYCNKEGHIAPSCPLKRNSFYSKKKIKQIWVP